MAVLHEPRPGKSIALNRALADLARAGGDGLAVFLDDDIMPDADWLLRCEDVAAAQGEFAIFAGVIRPLWEVEPPPWLLAWVELDVCFGLHRDWPEGECPDYVVYGGNMAVRTEAFRGGFRFGTEFGPDDRPNYAMGGETQFARDLAAAGHRAWHCRRAVVRHVIPAAHMTAAWLFNRAINYGRGEYRVGGETMKRLGGKSDARIAAHLGRAIAANRWRARLARLAGNRRAEFRALWRMNHLAGIAEEHRAAAGGRGEADRAPSPPTLAGVERAAR
jgi:hypothetical protein